MMIIRGAALLGVLMVGGCGQGAEAPAVQNRAGAVTIRNDYHDRMMKLGELQRGASLRTVIRGSKEPCDRVTVSAFQQDYTNLKMWTARCATTDYAVFVAPNGDVQVRKCAETAALKLPACRPMPAQKPQ